jgi:hypothetical protein
MKSDPDKVKFWQHHVDAYRESGLSLLKYSQQHQLKDYQLQYWIRKFRPQSASSSSAKDRQTFIPVQLLDEHKKVVGTCSSSNGIELRVGHFHLRLDTGFDHSLLREILEVVTPLC